MTFHFEPQGAPAGVDRQGNQTAPLAELKQKLEPTSTPSREGRPGQTPRPQTWQTTERVRILNSRQTETTQYAAMASNSPPAATVPAGTPTSTVYIRNLEESVKIPLLKQSLTAIFSQYGNIIDLVAKKNLKAKGQAFVVFDSPAAAEQAIKEVQAFPLFNKPMVLAFAKTRSDATVKREVGEESTEFEAHKRRRLAEKDRKQALAALESQRRPAAGTAVAATDAPKAAAKKTGGGLKSTAPAAAPQIPDEYLPPNTTLFLQNLPDDANDSMLTLLFARFDGFKEVRMVPGRKGIAFVEFEQLEGAIGAKEGMGGMVLEDRIVKVTYQRQ